MNPHPILFDGEAVRAILEGRKTQTRRPIKPQPTATYNKDGVALHIWKGTDWGDELSMACPYGLIGDRLWVRETFTYITLAENEWTGAPDQRRWRTGRHAVPVAMLYRADAEAEGWRIPAAWTPSIHMPRWASRIDLEVTDVRVEQLNDISLADVHAEGKPENIWPTELEFVWFRKQWNAIYAKRGLGWDANPWVWVVEFGRKK